MRLLIALTPQIAAGVAGGVRRNPAGSVCAGPVQGGKMSQLLRTAAVGLRGSAGVRSRSSGGGIVAVRPLACLPAWARSSSSPWPANQHPALQKALVTATCCSGHNRRRACAVVHPNREAQRMLLCPGCTPPILSAHRIPPHNHSGTPSRNTHPNQPAQSHQAPTQTTHPTKSRWNMNPKWCGIHAADGAGNGAGCWGVCACTSSQQQSGHRIQLK